MSVSKAVEAVLHFFQDTLSKQGRVIEVTPADDGWTALIETVEEGEYMKSIARDDLIAIYEVTVNQNFEVTGYSRKSMRERSEIETLE
ncbi:gas vesicle protein [bacterium]|nr:gas vesicle protein [bacterium]